MNNFTEIINKSMEYDKYIHEHRQNVFKALTILMENYDFDDFTENQKVLKDYLVMRIQTHDCIKYAPEEFEAYRNKFYPSPNFIFKEGSVSFNDAWEHHKQNTVHHWEAIWYINHDDDILKIDYIEMILDWTAMGFKFGDTAKEYYTNNKHKIQICEGYQEFVNKILDIMHEFCANKTDK